VVGVASFLYHREQSSGKTGMLHKFFGREDNPSGIGSGLNRFQVKKIASTADQRVIYAGGVRTMLLGYKTECS
jgi:phosphoribosylformimino-5-aminoimidazole carboxamide ribonucleotide (ProFAR) isomerase